MNVERQIVLPIMASLAVLGSAWWLVVPVDLYLAILGWSGPYYAAPPSLLRRKRWLRLAAAVLAILLVLGLLVRQVMPIGSPDRPIK